MNNKDQKQKQVMNHAANELVGMWANDFFKNKKR